MHPNLAQELAALSQLTVGQLRLKFADVFDEEDALQQQSLAGQTHCLAAASPGRGRSVRARRQRRRTGPGCRSASAAAVRGHKCCEGLSAKNTHPALAPIRAFHPLAAS